MKKILFLLEAFDKGGIEKVTLDIVNALDPQKYEITIETFKYGGYCQNLLHKNIEVRPFFFKHNIKGITRIIRYFPATWLYRFFVRKKYDIEIAASDGGAAKVISGSTNRNGKKICWVHMDVMKRGSQMKEFQTPEKAKKIYGKFDLIVPVSKACANSFKRKFGDGYNIVVKRNPILVKEILKNSMHNFEFPGENKLKIVCVGRLVEQKGFDRLISACFELKQNGKSNFIIYILGEGSQHEKLSSLILKYQLQDNIILYGFCENPYPIIKAADLFVLSSRDESFSLVIGESLVIGTPVMATDCCGIREWLGNNEYGLVVENSTQGIYKGLLSILEEPQLLNGYQAKIKEFKKKLSFEDSLRDFEELFQ